MCVCARTFATHTLLKTLFRTLFLFDLSLWKVWAYRFGGVLWGTCFMNILTIFFDEVFDEFIWPIILTNFLMDLLTNFFDEYFWRICWRIFLMNFLTIFNFLVDFFLTYNLLTVASFRIGVPSILFKVISNGKNHQKIIASFNDTNAEATYHNKQSRGVRMY